MLSKTLEGTSLKPEQLEMCAIKKVNEEIHIDWKETDEISTLIQNHKVISEAAAT